MKSYTLYNQEHRGVAAYTEQRVSAGDSRERGHEGGMKIYSIYNTVCEMSQFSNLHTLSPGLGKMSSSSSFKEEQRRL